MIFFIFVILGVLGIVVCAATGITSDKHDCRYKKSIYFVYNNDSLIYRIFRVIAVISGIVILIMLVCVIIVQISADGVKASNQQTYNALAYKAKTESVRDEFGIVNKEYIDEVQAWNENLAKCQSYSHNFWIGIFYPKRVYDGFEFIDLKSIRVKD